MGIACDETLYSFGDMGHLDRANEREHEVYDFDESWIRADWYHLCITVVEMGMGLGMYSSSEITA